MRPEAALDTKVINYFFDQVAIDVGPPAAKRSKPLTSAASAPSKTFVEKGLVRMMRDILIAEGGHTGPPIQVYFAQSASASTVARSDGKLASSRTHPLEPIHHAIWEQVTSSRNSLVVESAPAGGLGGQPWDDAALAGQPIRAIRINYQGGIDRIQVRFTPPYLACPAFTMTFRFYMGTPGETAMVEMCSIKIRSPSKPTR